MAVPQTKLRNGAAVDRLVSMAVGLFLGLVVALSVLACQTPLLAGTKESAVETLAGAGQHLSEDAAGSQLACGGSDWRLYGSHWGPCDMCGLNASAVEAALALDHNCSTDAFWGGAWRHVLELPKLDQGDPVCFMFCNKFIPCKTPPCVMRMYARPGSSDAIVIQHIFFKGTLDWIRSTSSVLSVLDAGGNCGAAAVYFSMAFPGSTVVSVEPSGANFDVLVKNIRLFPDSHAVHLALWSSIQSLCLVKGTRGAHLKGRKYAEWCFRVMPCKEIENGTQVLATLQGVPVSFLLETFNLRQFDVLKIDVEGAEGNIFAQSSNSDFLKTGRIALLEIHNDMWPDAGNIVLRAMKKFPRWNARSHLGEHDVWFSN